jgi:hypothetical protein
MPERDFNNARRSTRVFMRVRVVVAGKNSDSRRFREACETIVINAHGGLMYLNQPLAMDAMLVLTRNPESSFSARPLTKASAWASNSSRLRRISGALISFPPIGPRRPPLFAGASHP